MALRNCDITFTDNVLYSGKMVTGIVNLLLEKDITYKVLVLTIYGNIYTYYTKSVEAGKYSYRIYYSGENKYFESFNLKGEEDIQKYASKLVAGHHKFNFSFFLPSNFPSSFRGANGHIEYSAQVILTRPFKSDLKYTVPVTILSLVDLNAIAGLQVPIIKKSLKNFYFLFSSKGMLYMTIQIPYSGFVSGECIPVSCILKNDSQINVKYVKVDLIQKSTFIVTNPSFNVSRQYFTLSDCIGEGIDCGKEKTIELLLSVPEVTPSTSIMSSLINIKYELMVRAVMPFFYSNLITSIPIVIGTIPVKKSLT